MLGAKDLRGYMTYLSEEVKNLAARLGKVGVIDKKVEKSIRAELVTIFEDQLVSENPTPHAEVSLKAVQANCYLALPKAEWAMTLQQNLLSE